MKLSAFGYQPSTVSRQRRLSRRRLLAVAAAAIPVPAVLCAAVESWGDLVGRFVYDGKPPERKRLVVDKDGECCGKFDIRDESLMVGPDGGLANVFVYCRSPRVAVCPELAKSLPKRVLLDNRDCIFKPHCMAIWFGQQELHIVNSDPVDQNVDFRPTGDAPANIPLPAYHAKKSPDKQVEATWRFTRQQFTPVLIKCNLHPWESAHILIRANPYYGISGADGTFRIPKLPIGPFEFQLWHERPGYLDAPGWPKGRAEVAIGSGTTDLGTIRLAPAALEKT